MLDFRPKVLVIEDEENIRRFIRISLESEGATVHEANTAERGLIEAGTRQPDAIILDLNLPDHDGFSVLRELRTWTSVPVMVLSARHSEIDKIKALDEGADDYLTKPFGVGEMVARLRVILRRFVSQHSGLSSVEFGDVHVDLKRRLVTRGGSPVHLTAIEYRLLAVLLANRNKLMTHRELLREVWGPTHLESPHYLRIYIGHLRQKLERNPTQPTFFLTEVGIGYRFAA